MPAFPLICSAAAAQQWYQLHSDCCFSTVRVQLKGCEQEHKGEHCRAPREPQVQTLIRHRADITVRLITHICWESCSREKHSVCPLTALYCKVKAGTQVYIYFHLQGRKSKLISAKNQQPTEAIDLHGDPRFKYPTSETNWHVYSCCMITQWGIFTHPLSHYYIRIFKDEKPAV